MTDKVLIFTSKAVWSIEAFRSPFPVISFSSLLSLDFSEASLSLMDEVEVGLSSLSSSILSFLLINEGGFSVLSLLLASLMVGGLSPMLIFLLVSFNDTDLASGASFPSVPSELDSASPFVDFEPSFFLKKFEKLFENDWLRMKTNEKIPDLNRYRPYICWTYGHED